MKKMFAIFLTFALVLSLAACAQPAQEEVTEPAPEEVTEPAPEKTIYEHGMDLVSLIAEMAQSEEFRMIYTASLEIEEIITAAGQGDYSAPKAVYAIQPDFENMLSGVEAFQGMSPVLKHYVASKLNSMLASQLNAAGGATVLAASNICAADKTFVSATFSENTVYLYTFETGVPVLVTFTAGEDHSVTASACFILSNTTPTSNIKDVQQFFGDFGGVVTVVEP